MHNLIEYNLIEYIKNYSKISGSLWSYYRYESNSGAEGDINYSIKGSIKGSIIQGLIIKQAR